MIKSNEEKIKFILSRLGIFEDEFDENAPTILDNLYERQLETSQLCEYLSLIFKLLIESDVVPPYVLKKSKIFLEIANEKKRLERAIERYERNKKNKAPKDVLNDDTEKISEIKKKIRGLSDELVNTK